MGKPEFVKSISRQRIIGQQVVIFLEDDPLVILNLADLHPIATGTDILDWYAEHYGFSREKLTISFLETICFSSKVVPVLVTEPDKNCCKECHDQNDIKN